MEQFLSSWKPISFSRRTLLHGVSNSLNVTFSRGEWGNDKFYTRKFKQNSYQQCNTLHYSVSGNKHFLYQRFLIYWPYSPSNDLHSSITYPVQPFHSFYIWKEHLKQNMYIYYCVCMFIHKRNCREHVERIKWDTTTPPLPFLSHQQTKRRQYSNNLLIVTNLHFWQGGPSVPSSARLRVVCCSLENICVFKDRQIMIFVAWILVYIYKHKPLVGGHQPPTEQLRNIYCSCKMGNQCLSIQSLIHVCTFGIQDNTIVFYIFPLFICWCSHTHMTRMITMWHTCLPLLKDVDRYYDCIWNLLPWGCTTSCPIPVNTSILLTQSHDSKHQHSYY